MSIEFTWNEGERDFTFCHYRESWSSRRAIFSISLDFERKKLSYFQTIPNEINKITRIERKWEFYNLILNCNVILWHAKKLLLNVNFPLTGIHWIITARTIVYNLESAQNPFTRRVFCVYSTKIQLHFLRGIVESW